MFPIKFDGWSWINSDERPFADREFKLTKCKSKNKIFHVSEHKCALF